MLLGLRAEAQAVDLVDDLAEVAAGLNLVFDLGEDFADFVLDRVGVVGVSLNLRRYGKSLCSTKSVRSSLPAALTWSSVPSAFFGAAHDSQR